MDVRRFLFYSFYLLFLLLVYNSLLVTMVASERRTLTLEPKLIRWWGWGMYGFFCHSSIFPNNCPHLLSLLFNFSSLTEYLSLITPTPPLICILCIHAAAFFPYFSPAPHFKILPFFFFHLLILKYSCHVIFSFVLFLLFFFLFLQHSISFIW